jgi:hypothetical protein
VANTAPYRCPPPHQFPPAEECTQDQYLDIAARAVNGALHELMSSSSHVLGICHVVERLTLELETQQMLRAAALADANDLRRKHAALSEENRVLRIQAGLNTLALTVTGRSAADLSAEHAIDDRRERRAMQRYEAERQCAATIGSLTDRQRAMTVEIVDLVVERAQVRRIYIEPIHERFTDVLEHRADRIARGSQVVESYADFGADEKTVYDGEQVIA